MGSKKKNLVESAIVKMAHGIDYPVDTLLDVPSVHVIGRDNITVEGCKGILFYLDDKVTLDMGKFAVTFHGTNIELKNLSSVELSIRGKLSAITYDTKEDKSDAGKKTD